MRRGRFTLRSAAAALTLATASAAVAACGPPSIQSDELPVGVNRAPPEGGAVDREAQAEAGTNPDATSTLDSSTVIPDATPDGAVAAAKLLCQEPNLVLCFAFEGAVVDGSPNAAVPMVAGVSFAPGKAGSAASFNAGSAVRFTPLAVFDVTTATIEAWVKVAPNATVDGVVFDADNRASLTILVDGTVLCKPGNLAASTKVTSDQWTHVACVFDGTNARVYVGGAELGATAGVIGAGPTAGAAVGGNSPSGEPLVGAMDSLRFFNVARSPTQIAAAAAK